MKVLLLIGVLAIALPQCLGRLTANQLGRECYREWGHDPQGSKSDDQEQCSRLQVCELFFIELINLCLFSHCFDSFTFVFIW